MYISAGQSHWSVLILWHKDVYALVVQQCFKLLLFKPLCCLGHSSSLWYGWQHSQESPSICLARHNAVIVVAVHYKEQSKSYTQLIYVIYTMYILCKFDTYKGIFYKDSLGGQIVTSSHHLPAWTYWSWIFPTLLVYWVYQISFIMYVWRCPLSHQRAA